MEATIERKTATHVMMLWKNKPVNQNDALWCYVGPSIKMGNNVAGRRAWNEASKSVFW
jgi:hypothetical protein